LLKNGRQVLATGGGAQMDADTRNLIRDSGVSLWLKAEFEVVMARVRKKSTRPLLQNPNPEAVMRRLIDERYPIYAEAEVTVQSRDVPHDVVVTDIVDALERHFGLIGA